jgi:hypothetical protein
MTIIDKNPFTDLNNSKQIKNRITYTVKRSIYRNTLEKLPFYFRFQEHSQSFEYGKNNPRFSNNLVEN